MNVETMNCTGVGCSRRKTCAKHVFLRSGWKLFAPPDKPADCELYKQVYSDMDDNSPVNRLSEEKLTAILQMLAEQHVIRRRSIELNSKSIARRLDVSESLVYQVKNKYQKEINNIAKDIVIDLD